LESKGHGHDLTFQAHPRAKVLRQNESTYTCTCKISTYNLPDLPFQRGLKVRDQKCIQDIASFALCSHTTTIERPYFVPGMFITCTYTVSEI